MKYAVLADIHANLEALDAVIAAARAEGVDRFVCAGDIVGYHADPDACVERLRSIAAICIAGNHDRVAAGLAEPSRFGAVAKRAIVWTRARISNESRAFLASLPITAVVDDRFLLFHGALHPTPNCDLHLSDDARVSRSIEAFREGPWRVRLAFFGHTHRRVVHEAPARPAGERPPREASMIELCRDAHALVNPGSVGQPRDGDPRAAFAIYDAGSHAVRFCRVPFDEAACLLKVAREGLAPPAGRAARFADVVLGALRRFV